MSYHLFLDDERFPPSRDVDGGWVIARTVAEATAIVAQRGMPLFVSFDNDLGDDVEGWRFADWLIDRDNEGVLSNRADYLFPDGFDYVVHSQNSVRASDIPSRMDRYFRYKQQY
jgi:hypothetical protein